MNEWGLALQRNYVTFQDGGPQEFSDQNKSLGVNYLLRIIKIELLM